MAVQTLHKNAMETEAASAIIYEWHEKLKQYEP